MSLVDNFFGHYTGRQKFSPQIGSRELTTVVFRPITAKFRQIIVWPLKFRRKSANVPLLSQAGVFIRVRLRGGIPRFSTSVKVHKVRGSAGSWVLGVW
jgi:hypothetical protein